MLGNNENWQPEVVRKSLFYVQDIPQSPKKVEGEQIKINFLNYMLSGKETASSNSVYMFGVVSRTHKMYCYLKVKPKDNIVHLSWKMKLPFIKQKNYQNKGTQGHLMKVLIKTHIKNTFSNWDSYYHFIFVTEIIIHIRKIVSCVNLDTYRHFFSCLMYFPISY